ncbi:MAG: hypothetical protein FD146_1430 [Anaerolineaceae bacterium]|nr:MAG: hypothetical protein FD146_1430 [Anaerolineaceae bacterium]
MNEYYRAKFNELLTEFNRYLVEHPAFAEKFPAGAEVVLLDKRDSGYNRFVLDALKSDHPVVYIDVGELAPIHSRLKRPAVVSSPRAYAG